MPPGFRVNVFAAEPDVRNPIAMTWDSRGRMWVAENYTYTREGTPLDLVMPTEPGTYEIRYIMNQDRTILATRTIEISAVAASLTAPDTASVGETIEVAWDGPDYQNDFISVARTDDERGYENYTYTREGSPLVFYSGAFTQLPAAALARRQAEDQFLLEDTFGYYGSI